MFEIFQRRLKQLQHLRDKSLLKFQMRGVEKESLRVDHNGAMVATSHPQVLGSALTHPHITTDYAENLLELITAPKHTIAEVLKDLTYLHQFVTTHISSEQLWCASMPPPLTDDDIVIASYGTSPQGRIKHIYRRGLAHRYGKPMQCIAGIHFNFSFSEAFWHAFAELEGQSQADQTFKDEHYFGLIRNYHRYSWMIPFCFGASPLASQGYLPLDTVISENATSIRCGEHGYQNIAQADLAIDYNTLQGYIDSLYHAVSTQDDHFAKIPVMQDGVYEQLNDYILQIENEYYGFIRPKRRTQSLERPLQAIAERGVEYIECRALDCDPFAPIGITHETISFMEVLLTFCLLNESLPITPKEQQAIDNNFTQVVNEGLDMQLNLTMHGQTVSFKNTALLLLDALAQLARWMDHQQPDHHYQKAVEHQRQKFTGERATPAKQLHQTMQQNQQDYFGTVHQLSKQHDHYLKKLSMPGSELERLQALACQSLQKQQQLEKTPHQDFSRFLHDFIVFERPIVAR